MDNMNWGTWFRGAISALSSGIIIALTAIVVLKQPPTLWELFIIAIIPAALNFFSYIKQSPPPFGYKLVKDPTVVEPPK
jgi:peptidoglycan/LPS O-acetylase OafA/YrhL